MKKSTKTILAASGVAAVSAAVLVTLHQLTARGFMDMALNREAPKMLTRNRSKFMGKGDYSEFFTTLIDGAEKLRAKNTETIEISSHDGLNLVGHWAPCENAKRIVIAMHGWRSTWDRDFGVVSDFFSDNDCSVLYIQQRAQGESGGDYIGFGLLERYDCYEWIKWVESHNKGALPIYLSGVSMGATTAIMTSGFELPESVKGITADCGFTSAHEIWKHVAENSFKVPFGIYSSIANDIFKKKLNVGSKDYSCANALEKNKLPILFIHGTDDQFVPINMTFENYKSCKSKKHLFIVPGANHGMSFFVDPEGYKEQLKSFWALYDNS